MSDDYKLDDEFEYDGYRVGRPTRTVDIQGSGEDTHTVEAGVLTFELVTAEEIQRTREEDGWMAHYAAPDGGVGYNGANVPYDLVEIIVFNQPLTEKEADSWLEENRDEWEHLTSEIESDITADEFLEAIR